MNRNAYKLVCGMVISLALIFGCLCSANAQSGLGITLDNVAYDSKTESVTFIGKIVGSMNNLEIAWLAIDNIPLGPVEINPDGSWKIACDTCGVFGSGKHIVEASIMDTGENTTNTKREVYLPLSDAFVYAPRSFVELVNTPIELVYWHIGGTNVERRLEISKDEGKTWSALSTYTVGSSRGKFIWTPKNVGDFIIRVIAREKGSTDFIVSGQDSFTIVKSLTDVKLTFDKPSPQPVGTTIELHANPVRGRFLAVKFEISTDGKNWQQLREYSWETSYNWEPGKAGTYFLRVCGKEKLDSPKDESFSMATYVIK